MKKTSKPSGITLVEVVVFIAILGVLVAIGILAATREMTRGKMVGTLGNMRQLHLATHQMDLDLLEEGDTNSGWPGTNAGQDPSFSNWYENLTNGYLESRDARKMLSALEIVAPDPPTYADIALFVYQVGNVSEEAVPFLTTRNWDATAPTIPASTSHPYGNVGFIILRRNASGTIFNHASDGTNTALTVIVTNMPPQVVP